MWPFKVGDKVRLTGNSWHKDSSYGYPYQGAIVEIKKHEDDGYPVFRWRYPSGEEYPFFIDNTKSWSAELVEENKSEKNTYDEICVLDAQIYEKFAGTATETEILKKVQEQVESIVRRTYRAWPWNKKIAYKLDYYNQKVIAYWTEIPEEEKRFAA